MSLAARAREMQARWPPLPTISRIRITDSVWIKLSGAANPARANSASNYVRASSPLRGASQTRAQFLKRNAVSTHEGIVLRGQQRERIVEQMLPDHVPDRRRIAQRADDHVDLAASDP